MSNLSKKRERPSQSSANQSARQRTLHELYADRESDSCQSRTAPPHSQPMRQASITDLRGVVRWQEQQPTHAALASVPPTLYLGHEDVTRLRKLLEDESVNDETVLATLRRLAAMPCTRSLLASTRIGVAVGKLRKHENKDISYLAANIVKVWKSQLKEHRDQELDAVRNPRSF